LNEIKIFLTTLRFPLGLTRK